MQSNDQQHDQPAASPTREPIAIVGIGCRFPGANDARAFWDLIVEGRSAIVDVPPDRFAVEAFHDPRPKTRGKLSSRRGGFIADAWGFDADHFGISPREAARIDPQHRVMLEVASEALEDAFFTKSELARHTAGVYIGCWASDWECHEYADRDNSDVYSLPGAARCLISGRVSFAFDLRGPSLTVDTGCSASLIATHLACQSLWLGECSVAVCGGVNLVLDPKPGISFSLAGMLAPDGMCKAFDSRADGFVRSDGCGAVILMPLRQALARGVRIYALIRGSGASNDGFSNGLLTTPSEIGQEAAMRAAYRSAQLVPSDVQYIEAHGTGTPAGDPVELRALAAVMRERPEGEPCLVGSVKTNIGHTEGAAGVAGLIKTALALHHRTIPKSLHFDAPTPLVAWDDLRLAVAATSRPWPQGVARAGVSSFGISGTDVHVLLEQAPLQQAAPGADEGTRAELLAISADSDAALQASAAAYRALLARPAAESGRLHDICFSAALGREHYGRRLAAVGCSRDGMIGALDAYLAGEPHAGVFVERAAGQDSGSVFVFSGQGSQWQGMGLSLLDSEPVFRETLEACDAALRPYAGWSLIDELRRDRGDARTPIDIIQPSIFAIQVALAASLRSFGVTPRLVIGHSMGEVAAAHVAGVLNLDDAARIICHRSRLLENITGRGGMLSVDLGFEEASALVEAYAGRVSVAASNGTHTTVLSGEREALSEIEAGLLAREVFCREVQVAAAAHSPQLDPQLPGLRRALEGVAPSAGATTPLCSTVTGRILSPDQLDADYWVRNMREPVRFSGALQWLLEQGYTRFVEISPHPVLLGPIQQIAQSAGKPAVTLQVLRRDAPEREQLLGALGRLHVLGQALDLRPLFGPEARFVSLPSYPLQHERFDTRPSGSQPSATGFDAASLGPALRSAIQPKTYLWETALSVERSSYLRDHKVAGAVTLPGAAYVDMALQAAGRVFGTSQFAIEQLELSTALIVPPESETQLQVALCRDQPGLATIRFLSQQPDAEAGFRLHASASARLLEVAPSAPSPIDPAAVQSRCDAVALPEHFRTAREHGIDYGPAFQGLQEVWVGEDEAFARVGLPSHVAFRKGAFFIHPALLDACWQAAAALLFSQAGSDALYLPVEVESVQSFAEPGTEVFAHARLRTPLAAATSQVVLDVSVCDLEGNVLLVTSGLALRPIAAHSQADEALYALAWRESARARAAGPTQDLVGQTWIVLMDPTRRLGEQVARALEACGAHCVCAYPRHSPSPAVRAVDPSRPEELEALVADALRVGSLHGVVDLWSLEGISTQLATSETLLRAQDDGVIALTHLLQALDAAEHTSLRVWVVTAETQPVVPEQAIEIAQAPLWGLSRVLRVELPQIKLQCLDISKDSTPSELDQLLGELLDPEDCFEDHLALRGDRRFVMRWVRAPLAADAATAPLPAASSGGASVPCYLTMPAPGIFDQLQLRECERLPPEPGEIEIEVVAAGLNFIDVMKALGVYPGLGDEPIAFGGECTGRVSAIGAGVQGFELGQRVVAMGSTGPCFARFTTTRACLAVPLPDSLDFAAGATIPAVFLTAHYALNTLGRLTRGERVLIHSGTGGVGLAAIQLARRVGAEVIATAGSERKRQYLRELGVQHVYDSRSTAFAAEIQAATGGEGVDVVLNSLAGDAIPASLGLLRDDGRFLEIGKRDIYADMQLGLSPFKRGLLFTHIDLARLARDRSPLLGDLLRELMGWFEAGELQPLPREEFPITRAADAFRYMAQAKHIGKLVLSLQDPELDANVLPTRALVRAGASYLVTGGLSGIGLLTAEWLADQGAKHLALLGRRAPSDDARAAIERLRQRGVAVQVHACDVGRAEQLARVLASVAAELPPLRGVIHSAGLLDDGLARQLTRERFWKVMEPKLLGAFHLHQQTAQLPLDFFVMFSSGAAALGSPGQGNYAAANEFMDALAHARQRQGLPGLAIDWGTWSETGMAMGAERAGRLLLRGMGTMSNAQGLHLLGELMRTRRARAICLVNANLQRWVQYNPTAAQGGMLDELLKALPVRAPESEVLASILQAAPEARLGLLTAHIVDAVRRVLRISTSKAIDLDVPLNRFGIDSLMAIELKNRLEFDLGMTIQVSKILLSPGLQSLAGELLEAMQGASDRPVAPSAAPAAPADALGRLFTDLDAGSQLLDSDESLPVADAGSTA